MGDEAWSRNAGQISYLICRYAECIDSGDLESLADLLSEAGFGADSGPLARGRDRILDLYRKTVRIYDDGTPRTKHLVTNIVIEVDEGATSASARSYWTVLQATPDKPLGPILSGRYNDKFERREGEWLFTERRITTDLAGDVSAHMLPGAERLVNATDD
jgi:hypothetical protein